MRFAVDDILRFTIKVSFREVKSAELSKLLQNDFDWDELDRNLDYNRLSLILLSLIHI
jgi:hypothetical protein